MAWRVIVGGTATELVDVEPGTPEFHVHVYSGEKDLWIGGPSVTMATGYFVDAKTRAGPFLISSELPLYGIRKSGESAEVSVMND